MNRERERIIKKQHSLRSKTPCSLLQGIFNVDGNPPYQHIGDGGLFDNLGTESLATLFLKKIPKMDLTKRGIIIVVDAAYSFDVGKHPLDQNQKGFEMFVEDPSRIVGVMEQRANA